MTPKGGVHLCDGWKKKKSICTFPWACACVCVCVCVHEICGALRLLFLSHPTHLPVWRSVRASPVTFSGSWTPGPFSVTLCCHFWLVQPRQWCTRTVGGKMIYSPTSRSAWLKVVVFFPPTAPSYCLLLAQNTTHTATIRTAKKREGFLAM